LVLPALVREGFYGVRQREVRVAAKKKKEKKKRVNILTVCGVGSGSSLILRMYTEDVLEELGLRYKVQAGQASEARGTNADIVMCATDFYSVCKGSSAIVVPIARLTDKDLIRESLTGPLQELGFLDDTGEPG
jgi:PTS system ascorbate-specific IIB component